MAKQMNAGLRYCFALFEVIVGLVVVFGSIALFVGAIWAVVEFGIWVVYLYIFLLVFVALPLSLMKDGWEVYYVQHEKYPTTHNEFCFWLKRPVKSYWWKR